MSLDTNKKVVTTWLISEEEFNKINAENANKTSEELAKNGNNETREGYWFSCATKNEDGSCVIDITGGLYTRDYKYLAALIEMCENDKTVDKIILDINSPGGSVPGLFDFCETIRACDKPVYTYTSTSLCSAAYAIGVSTKKIYATRGATIGSVGALITLSDYSEMYTKMGIKIETITSKNAENKVIDISSKEGKAILQERVDYAEQMFVEHIASCRDITTEKVLSDFGHGSVFYGDVAKEKGMIDAIVKNFDECMSNINDSTQIGGEESVMTLQELEKQDPTAYAKLMGDAEAKATTKAESEVRAQAQKDERERISAIGTFGKLKAIGGVAEVLAKAIADGTSVEETKALAFDAILANYKEPVAKTEPKEVNANTETLNALVTETAANTPSVTTEATSTTPKSPVEQMQAEALALANEMNEGEAK